MVSPSLKFPFLTSQLFSWSQSYWLVLQFKSTSGFNFLMTGDGPEIVLPSLETAGSSGHLGVKE